MPLDNPCISDNSFLMLCKTRILYIYIYILMLKGHCCVLLEFVLYMYVTLFTIEEGTKRKISENGTQLGGESKRAVPDEEERESEQKSEAPQSTTAKQAVAARDSEKDGVKVSGGHPRELSGATEDRGHRQDNRENSNERDSVGQKPGGKRRHPTDGSQESPRVPNSKKILMGKCSTKGLPVYQLFLFGCFFPKI